MKRKLDKWQEYNKFKRIEGFARAALSGVALRPGLTAQMIAETAWRIGEAMEAARPKMPVPD